MGDGASEIIKHPQRCNIVRAYALQFAVARFIVDLRINGTLQTGAVKNRIYKLINPGGASNSVRLETAPTGPDNKFIPIYRGDRSRGAKVSIYF